MGADRKGFISIFCAFVFCVSSVLEDNNQEMDGRALLSVVLFIRCLVSVHICSEIVPELADSNTYDSPVLSRSLKWP